MYFLQFMSLYHIKGVPKFVDERISLYHEMLISVFNNSETFLQSLDQENSVEMTQLQNECVQF